MPFGTKKKKEAYSARLYDSPEPSDGYEPPDSHELLARAMSRLLRDGENSDMIIKCENLTFKAHRCIVYPSSDFFRAAIDGNFYESKLKEVRLVGDDPASVERMMSYIYTFDYPVTIIEEVVASEEVSEPGYNDVQKPYEASAASSPPGSPSLQGPEEVPTTEEEGNSITPLEVHAQMYAIGDKYGILGLEDLSRKNLMRLLRTELAIVPKPFLNVVRIIYSATIEPTDPMRLALASVAKDFISILRQQDDFKATGADHMDFWSDILDTLP